MTNLSRSLNSLPDFELHGSEGILFHFYLYNKNTVETVIQEGRWAMTGRGCHYPPKQVIKDEKK
jgi:hypothetical protein